MNETAKTETFYKLTNEEWLKMTSLRHAETKVLLYLRTLDPFGDHPVDISVRELGKAVGITHSTAAKALRELSKLGWINVKVVDISVRIDTQSKSKEVCPTGHEIVPQDTGLSYRTQTASRTLS